MNCLGLSGSEVMPKYVMVDTISQFRMRYVVEVPDDVEKPIWVCSKGMPCAGKYPCTPEAYASDTVVCEETREFSQENLGETIVSTREVSLEEAIAQYRKDEPTLGEAWDDETIIKNNITEIGFGYNRKEYEEQEEDQWKNQEWYKENNERIDIIGQNGNDGLHYDSDGGLDSFK